MSYAGLRQEKIVAETIRNWQARYGPPAMLRVTAIRLPRLGRSLPRGILDIQPLPPCDALDRISKPGPHRIIRSTGSTGHTRPTDEDSAALGATQFAQHEAFQAPCAKKLAQHGPNTGTSAKKLAQHGPNTGTSAKKLAQQTQMQLNLGVFGALGELFRAVALKQRRRANFFAHNPRRRSDVETADTSACRPSTPSETDDTIARLPELTNETAITIASPQHPKNQHFPRAKVSPVSSQRSHKVAKVSPVSSRRSSALDTAPMHQIAQH